MKLSESEGRRRPATAADEQGEAIAVVTQPRIAKIRVLVEGRGWELVHGAVGGWYLRRPV
jgi:hypothetical protein